MRLAPLLILVALAACATTHAGKVATVQQTYTEVAKTLVDLRLAGKINDADWAKVKAADLLVKQAVDDFRDGRTTYVAALNALAGLEAFLVKIKEIP
jgi:hypothetical protein